MLERNTLTRPFNDTVRERFLCDESFREALIAEAFKEIESGEKAVGLAILNDCVLPALPAKESDAKAGSPR